MKFKRFLSIILSCGLLASLVVYPCTVSAEKELASSVSDTSHIIEQKSYCSATTNDHFEDDTILVVLSANHSRINSDVSSLFSSNKSVKKVEDISRIENPEVLKNINEDEYHQILRLTIPSGGKDKLLSTIKELEQNEAVLSASPDFTYYATEITDSSFNHTSNSDTLLLEDEPNQPATSKASESVVQETTIDATTSNDPQKSGQYAINLLDLPEAWSITKGYSEVKVGVLDSGISSSHEDLAANLDTSLGANFSGELLGPWMDLVGHGTHVAGIIGAVGNNGKGVTGTCWNIKLVSIKVFRLDPLTGKAVGLSSSIISAINYAINNQITILNYSGGGSGYSAAVEAAIENFKGLFICAAGNESTNTPQYPAALPCKNIISVASSSNSDKLSTFSNYSPTTVDLAAPGTNILSTLPNNRYGYMSGTSMAAPYVTGVAALLKSYNMDLSAMQIKDSILNGVDKIASLSGNCVTGGRLNANKALNLAKQIRWAKFSFMAGDFNGDSVIETAGTFGSALNPNTRLLIWENSSGKFDRTYPDDIYNLGTPIVNVDGTCTAGDYNGDGCDEIAYITGDNSCSKVFLLSYKGNITPASSQRIFTTTTVSVNNIRNRVASGDFDGDGKDEIGIIENCSDTNGKYLKFWYVDFHSNGTSSLVYIKRTGSANAAAISSGVAAGDYDGDGRDEFGYLYDYGSYLKMFIVGVNANNSYDDYPLGPTGSFPGKGIVQNIVAGDFDCDGTDEISLVYNYGNYLKMWIFERTASGLFNHYIVGKTGSFPGTGVVGVTSGNIKNQRKDEMLLIFNYTPYTATWLFERTTSGGFNHYKIVK